MKKVLVVLSSILVLVLFLAACGQEDVPATDYDDYDYAAYEPSDVVAEDVVDYECIQLTEFPTDWTEMFNLSACDWFGESKPESLWGAAGGAYYPHPTNEDITLVFGYSRYTPLNEQFPPSIRLTTEILLGQASISIAELREMFGDELWVAMGDFNDWQAGFDLDDDFAVHILLRDENDDNITHMTVVPIRFLNRCDFSALQFPEVQSLGGNHPIVGTWDNLWVDPHAFVDSQTTFNEDGTGFIVNFGNRSLDFTWGINDDILSIIHPPSEFWPYSSTGNYRVTVNDDILARTLYSINSTYCELQAVQTFYFARIN